VAVLVSERHAHAGPVVHHAPGLNCVRFEPAALRHRPDQPRGDRETLRRKPCGMTMSVATRCPRKRVNSRGDPASEFLTGRQGGDRFERCRCDGLQQVWAVQGVVRLLGRILASRDLLKFDASVWQVLDRRVHRVLALANDLKARGLGTSTGVLAGGTSRHGEDPARHRRGDRAGGGGHRADPGLLRHRVPPDRAVRPDGRPLAP